MLTYSLLHMQPLCRVEAAIIAALLHDVLDTEQTLQDVEAHAGSEVTKLVSSVARLSRNNQLLRRAHRRLLAEGKTEQAAEEVEVMKSMILEMTEEPLVRHLPP
jgi:(p)ppGpp synthase/HD superfamily hydrolase